LLTLGSALGTTGNRTLVENSLPAGSWPRSRYAFFLLALRKLTGFENIPCVYLLTGPSSFLTTVILRSYQDFFVFAPRNPFSKSLPTAITPKMNMLSPGPSEEILDPRSVPREALFKLGDGKVSGKVSLAVQRFRKVGPDSAGRR
jgi:hypothetical protein